MAPNTQHETAAAVRPDAGDPPTIGNGTWRHALKNFFFVEQPGQDGRRSEDHLAIAARHDPMAAARFIKIIAKLSAAFSIGVGIMCTGFLFVYWQRCASCNRPIRWWLLVQALLQAGQLPMRLILYFCVRAAEQAGESISECVSAITASPAWSASRAVAIAHYCWIVLGVVWWTHLEPCDTCPGIGRLAALVIVLCAARTVAAMVTFRVLFSQDEQVADAPKVVAATKDQIAALPLVRLSGISCGDDARSCSICLVEFTGGEMVKRLPCKHDFHSRCIDTWLQRSKRCPLCVRAVDEPPPMGLKADQCGVCTDKQEGSSSSEGLRRR